ncbi:LAFE_0A01310g1_1 [Lachancea fermentati]|uniref:LAFE_0A01310g1_1 n=1 Tax=Lachancea fermentati TaxID=4955 RepID=A0A1G4M6D3_LACFM|nr:LAFE_0A01310g1_1 [Lachancea fermentati]
MLLYQRIHQRCPPPQVLDTLLADPAPLSAPEFVAQFARVRARNPHYAKTLVKALIDNWPAIDQAVPIDPGPTHPVYLDEWLYEQYVELLPVPPPGPTASDLITYTFGPVALDIHETPHLICAQGTTGLRTWEAALYLCHYLQQHQNEHGPDGPGHVTSALELGAGTALVSLVWAQLNSTRDFSLYVTDGDRSLVDTCAKPNFDRNGLVGPRFHFQKLWWGADPVPKVDLVLAADVTYDSAAVPHLVACVATALHQGAHHALVAATLRNSDTIRVFEAACSAAGLNCTVLQSTETSDPTEFVRNCTFKPLIAPIRIYEITLCSR